MSLPTNPDPASPAKPVVSVPVPVLAPARSSRPTRTEFFGVLDFRNPGGYTFDPPELVGAIGGVVEVDGQEVRQTFYADTKDVVVRTYDVMGDGRAHSSAEDRFKNRDDLTLQHRAEKEGWEVFPSGVLWKTVKGKVRVFGPEA